ncbi:hypothetical protein D3C86_1437330 [compost metagenome]
MHPGTCFHLQLFHWDIKSTWEAVIMLEILLPLKCFTMEQRFRTPLSAVFISTVLMLTTWGFLWMTFRTITVKLGFRASIISQPVLLTICMSLLFPIKRRPAAVFSSRKPFTRTFLKRIIGRSIRPFRLTWFRWPYRITFL